MTKRVVCLRSDISIKNASIILNKNKISGAPVVRGGKIIGIFSRADLVRSYSVIKKTGKGMLNINVEDVMTKKVHLLDKDSSIVDAIRTMKTCNINRVPIIDKKKRPVGIVSRKDIIDNIAKNRKLLKYIEATN